MEITDITATIHRVPIELPLLDHRAEWEIVFVRVETDAGPTGYGLTAMPQVFGIRAFVEREIAPLLAGEDPIETEYLWRRMQRQLNPRMQTGVWSSAVSAVDIALWDIKGKHTGEPVWRLLGGARDTVPTYVTFGLKDYDIDQLSELASDFVAQGEHRLKMKVGINDAADPREDARRVEAVREAVGDDIDLMIDANYEFSVETALRLCRQIEQYDVTWFEEPVYGNDVNLLAELRRRTDIPIAAGQNEGHRIKHRELIENGAVDISQLNVCHVGGYTEGKRVASTAHSFNRRIANGAGWPHHNMHLHAGVSNGWLVEFHHIPWQIGETIYQEPPEPVDGEVQLKTDPGLGLEPDWEALDRYEVE